MFCNTENFSMKSCFHDHFLPSPAGQPRLSQYPAVSDTDSENE